MRPARRGKLKHAKEGGSEDNASKDHPYILCGERLNEMKSRLRFRTAFGWLLLLGVWQSLVVMQPEQWQLNALKKNIRALAQSITLPPSLDLTDERPVHCYNSTYCCGSWNVSADRWWTHHPDWVVQSEDATSFCFSPIHNAFVRAFLHEVHWLQWNIHISSDEQDLSLALQETHNFTVNCSDMVASVSINSGFGASRPWLLAPFYFAYTHQRPYQTIAKYEWMYAIANGNQDSTWTNCTERDQSCFYLPISPCSREDKDRPRDQRYPDKRNETQLIQWRWLQEYMTRPKQPLRQEMQRLRQPLEEQLKGGCVGMHVRRGDAATPQPPWRRYAAVQEYLDKIDNLQDNATIFLMTDDANTIDEVQQLHASKYNWVYSNKIRVHGLENGFNIHVPPGSSGPEEIAWMTVELELLSSHCDAFVHGRSGMAHTAIELAKHKGREMQIYYVNTDVSKQEVQAFSGKPYEREAHLMNQVNARYDQRCEFDVNTRRFACNGTAVGSTE